MAERVCECGNKLSSINHSLKCFKCRQASKRIKQQTDREKRIDDLKQAGLILVHSCLSDSRFDPASSNCACRKFVPVERAKHMLAIGRCLDMVTRDACYRGGPVVEVSRLKKTARARFVDRADIERSYASTDRGLKGKTIEELNAIIAADKQDRTLEEQLRIEIIGEMKAEMLRNMTREVPEDEWLALERIHLDVPMLPSPSADQRTLGGIGRTGSSHFGLLVEDTAEFVDVEETEEPECNSSGEDAELIDAEETNDIGESNPEQFEDDEDQVRIIDDHEEIEVEEAA
jgi:hypothetical protein